MSELAALLKKPIEVPVAGTVLKFSRLNDRIRLSLEEWAEGVLTADYEKLAALAPDEATRLRLFGALEKAVLSHDYAFGRPGFMALLSAEVGGGATFAYEMLREHQPDITRDEVIELVLTYPEVMDGLMRALQADAKKKDRPGGPLTRPTPAATTT